MARYSALGFYKEDGTLDNELVEKTISEPEGQVDVGNPDQPAPSSANVEKPEGGDAEGFEMPTIGSQALDDLKKWNASLTPRDRVSNRLKDYDPEAAPEEEREGVNKAIFEHLCTSPEYLGWGGASANERGVFGLPYGSKTWTQKVQMLKDWACGSGQLMSDDQEEFNALNEEAKRTGDYTKVNELVRSKGEDIWEWVGQGFNIEGLVEKAVMEKLPKDLMDVHAAARAVRNASGMNGIADTAAALAVVQRNYNSIEPERKARYESFISQFKNEANAKLAAERRDAYRAKLDTKNTLQMLELNGETMSDRSRAFVASTAASGVFDGRAFMSLPDAERGHVLACVKIRRGELTKGFGFIPLKDENGKTIDTNRIIYGIGRSITDIPVDTMRTLDDFCSVANAELGTTINPVSIILDPTPWYISLPKEIATKLWNTIGKSSEQIKTERENAYKALELSHQVRNAMTQEIPDASNFWTRSGAGFGDNFGFLLISEVGGFGKLAASRGIKIAENVANGGKVGKVDQFLFSNFVRAGREIGKGRDALKAINLANAPKDVRTAVKIYGEAKRGLPAAKAEYNAALHQFNLAKKTGVNMRESAERLSKASAEYAKMARNANPSVAYEEALSQGQFFRDIVKVNEQIESYMQSVREMGKGIETVGKVAEQAMWYLPFYTRQLDRAAAQGLPMEQAAHRAFVTMITSGWTEKKAITAAAKIGLPAKTLTEQSWKTICTDFIQAFRAKTLGNAMSAAKAGGKALFLREVTNVHHGLDSAVNVTAQSVMDECALLCGEIWDEAKRDWDRGFTVRKDKDGNPVKNFNGDTIVDAFGTKDAFLRFANELVGNGRLVETALNVVKEGAYPAVGFALLSGTNARFGHWRNEIAMRSNLKAGMGERAYSNYALKDGGLAEVYSGMERTQDAVYQFALNDVMKERREEIDNVRAAGDKETADKLEESFKKDAKAIEREAGGRYSMIMGRVMNSIERANGSTEQVQAICDDFGVDAQTAELLKSMANDYSALRWRDDFNSIWGNFEVGKRITPEGAWSKMRSIFTIRNAEFAFKNFARLAPNVANYTDHGDGTYDVDVDLGNGRSVKVGVSINRQITKALIEESIADGGEVSRLYERMNGTGSWSLLDRAEKKDFAAEYIEGNNRRGGGFYFVGSDGKKYLMPIADVADVITLTDRAQGHVVSHEVSHTIFRAAEEMGFIDLDTKGRLADALAIDRVGDAATRLTDEVSPDGHRKQAWEIEVDEAIARGYADYTNGRSMVAVPAVREGFDKVNRVFDFLRGIFATEAMNNETPLDDFYEAMMRGDLEALKGIAGDMSHAQSADKKIVRDQALAKVQAARELLARSSEAGKEQARKNLKAAQAELKQANAEWDRVRRDRFERLVGADDGRNSISDDEWERLEENFGVTKNPLETGWITPRGSMLDFSGAHWVDDRKAPNPNHRMVDHADVKEVLSRDFDSNWEYRNEMLDSGAIRTMPEIQALGLARDITAEQEDALYDYIDGIRGDNDITVEFYGDEMRSTDVMTFDGRVSPRAVIRAIHEHFEKVAPHRIYNENKQVSKKVTDGKDETGVTRYSLATYEDGGRTVLDTFLRDEVSRGELAAADARDIIDATDKIYEIAKRLAKDKRFVNFGNWSQAQVETDEDGHPYFGVIRTNGDYAYNIDFSTVCKKRRPLDYVFGELVRQGVVNESNISKLLSEKNIPKIQDVIKRHGLEVACALCFVDSKRYKIGGDLNKFASIWNNLVDGRENDSAVWRKTISSAMKKEKSGKARNYAERCALTILTSEAARVRVNPTELVNADRFDEWVKANPKVFEMFRSFKGQAKAKDSTGDVPYNNDVIKLFKHRMNENVPAKIKPEDAYAVGGVRLQSFSDFVPKLVFDYVQLWSELAARKLPLHVYTKEPDLVKLFGRTGAKINMSLVPANTGLKADGSYDFADECFPPEEAFKLRDKYGNVGTIMVGINDAHILKCLDDDRIDMVIPYHKSSINPAVAAARGIGKWKDYTSYQHTKGAPKGKDFDFYGSLAKTHDPRRTATEYLKWCKKNGYTPKFKQFSNHPNYYKVLADFRLYDADGKYSPQGAVRQVTPDKAWQKAIVEALKHDQADADRLAYEAQPVIDEIKGEVFGFAEGGRNSLALPPELSGALSTEDLLRMAAAGRLAKNGAGEASVRDDMAKRLKELNPNSTDADVDRLIGEAKVEAKAILNGMTNTADAEIMNRLTARQLNKYLSSLRMSGRKGITAGSGSERARQELDKRQAQKIADSIAAQTGISVNELESSLGVDLAETMTILGDIYQEAEKAAMGERPAEAEGGDEVLPMPESAEDTIPLTPEEQERREADIRSLCMDILHKAWEKDAKWQAKKEQRRVDRERQRNTEGEVPAEDDVGGGEELPTTADDLATFIATKQAIDLRNPNQFAQFIAIMCEEKWKADHGLAEDAFVWDDPVALQHLRMTAAGVYDSLARKLMYSNRRETAFNAIAEMENCPTFGSLIGKMEFTGKVIASGMVTEKANELVTDIDRLLKQAFGAKGRFSQNKENKDRKVSGETELWARDVRKVLRWGDEKVSSEYNLLMQRLAGVEAAFQLAGRDPQSAKQFAKDMRMIEVLHDFGGLVHKSLGEITDARIKILDRLDSDKVGEEAQAREERTLGIAEMIEKAVETGRTFAYDDKHIGALKKTGRSISKYFQEHLDFKHLLLDLSRYCKDGEAKAKYEEWVNNLQHEIQRRWDKAQTEKRVEALALKQAVEHIYGGKFDKVMRELMKHDERFDPFGEMIERQMVDAKPDSVIDEMNGGKKKEVERKFKVSMSRAQAMNLYVALQQKGYLDNVVKNNRQGQAAELRKLFTKEDLQVIKWLGDWYDRSRQGISDVSVRIFGLPVEAEESNYFPVTPHRATQGLNEMTSDTWSPFPPALTPRVKHGLDFDVRTDIFSVWMERMQEQAQWKNMAEFGVELRGIFGRQSLQSTIRHCHGEQALSNVKAFINDILRGQVQIKGKNSAVDWMRGWTALSALGGNLGVMLKQTTSIPAFAFEVGFTNLAKYLNPVEMFSAEGRQAMAAIWNSDQRKNRADFANWKAGGSEEVENAFNDANPSRLKKLMQKSMVFNSMGDLVPSLFVGQGIYRSYLAQGVDAEEAMNRTWELINRTQQTGQMDNLTGFQRRSSLGRFATQFQTAVRQYAAYEISAIRNALANPSKKTSIDLIRATACNAVLASLYYWGGAIWQWILGKKPDEETVDGWVKSVLNSCWTSLFFAGAFVQSVSDIIVDGKTRQGATIPSMALTGTVIVDALSAIRSLIDEEKDADDVLKSIDHGLKAFLSPYRDLSKVYHWRIQGEPPDGGAKKSIKKKSLKKKKPLKRR